MRLKSQIAYFVYKKRIDKISALLTSARGIIYSIDYCDLVGWQLLHSIDDRLGYLSILVYQLDTYYKDLQKSFNKMTKDTK